MGLGGTGGPHILALQLAGGPREDSAGSWQMPGCHGQVLGGESLQDPRLPSPGLVRTKGLEGGRELPDRLGQHGPVCPRSGRGVLTGQPGPSAALRGSAEGRRRPDCSESSSSGDQPLAP